jgi:5'-nucleotidase
LILSRYTSDLVAASALPGLDLVIGGHSHSFLWPNPDAPPAFYMSDEPDTGNQYDSTWGPYPTYVHTKGRDVPVVQASWGSRYMGKIVLEFEPEKDGGKVSGVKSEMYLLGGPKSERHVQEDEEALQMIQKWRSWR